jgi:hypothetical protein
MKTGIPNVLQLSRRDILAGGTALTIAATAAHSREPASPRCDRVPLAKPQPVQLDDAALLTAFMKLRGSTDSRMTIGWIDAVNYGFIDGDTFPLYRLWAATWQVCRRIDERSFQTTSLEIAHFVDMKSGALLEKLVMPPTGVTVDVPHYRAGPSQSKVALHREEKREFKPNADAAGGARFFISGTATSSQHISQLERDGSRVRIREDVHTRVVNDDPATRGFFYREWSQWSGDWREVFDPSVACARCEVGYAAAAGWRPWMKMGNAAGNTLQNGRGGKVENPADLPPELLRLTKIIQPDLLADPWQALHLTRS